MVTKEAQGMAAGVVTKAAERGSTNMGTFSVAMGVGDLDRGPLTPVVAMVDTGAFDSMLPASFLKGLGLEPLDREVFTLADGSEVEYETGTARIGLGERERPCPVAFGPEGQYLLGATTLEIFRLMVDPVDQQLVRRRMRGRPI